MRKTVFLAVAAMGSCLFVASPSSAQPQLQFGIGPDGRPQVGVRDPEQERYERRERWRERRQEDRSRAGASCGTGEPRQRMAAPVCRPSTMISFGSFER